MELINPILHRELRQGLLGRRWVVIQWLFVALMAVVVWLAWPRTPKMQVEKIVISRQLFSLFWGGLYFTVAVLAAALSAVAITREKETGCFELLCTTGMSTSRLLLGKFLAVVGYLLLLVVSSVPITAACYLLGGAGWQHIALNYADLVVAAFLYGGIGLACSCLFERNHRALSVAFAITLPLAAWSVASQDAKHWIEALGLMTLAVIGEKIVERVRRPREEYDPPGTFGQTIEISVNTDSMMDRLLVPQRAAKPLSDAKNPVYEREWIEESGEEGRTWWHFLLRFNIGVGILVLIFLVFGRFWLQDYADRYAPGQYESLLAEYAGLALLGLFSYLIVVAVLVGPAQSANAISKEREHQTLDLLLTTLLTPREIIFGKWRLNLRSSFHLMVLLLLPLLPVLGLIIFGRSASQSIGSLLATGLCGLIVVGVTLMTLNTLGTFCSLVCKSSTQALSVTYAVAVGWFVGPVVLYYVLSNFSELSPTVYAWPTYATPFLSFFSICGSDFFRAVPLSEQPSRLGVIYIGMTLVVSAALLAVSVLRFDRFWKR